MATQLPVNFSGSDWVALRVHLLGLLERDTKGLERIGLESHLTDGLRGRIQVIRELLALEDAPKQRHPQAQ